MSYNEKVLKVKRQRTNDGVVNALLDDMRASASMTEDQIKRSCKYVYEQACQAGKIYNKVFAGVPLECIYIDSGYQRTESFSKRKGNSIATNFNENVYEPIKLNYRNGVFYCPSGQHRVYAHIKMKREYIVAELTAVSRSEEIDIFLMQDSDRSKLCPYDTWKAGCEKGDGTQTAIRDICSQYNVAIAKRHGRAQIGSISTAARIVNQHGEGMLRLIFDTIQEAGWHDEMKAFDSRMLRSLAHIYGSSRAIASEEIKRKLVNVFAYKTPVELCANAQSAYPHKDAEMSLWAFLEDIIDGRRVLR